MQYKLAVFDIAGTTVKDNDAGVRSFHQAFRRFGFYVPKSIINPLMGYKKTTAIDMVLRKYDKHANAETISEIHEVFVNQMESYYSTSEEVAPAASAEVVMQMLKDKGIKIALNTGFPLSVARTIVKRLGWMERKLVDDYIASDEVEHGRPDPSMINILRERNGNCKPAEVLKVGDTEVDIREGQNAGCGLVVAVTTGAFDRAELARYSPDHIIDNLAELTPLIYKFAEHRTAGR